MAELDYREWLLTNGLGSFASGTICDVRTRTYHGWLFVATNPPVERRLLLSHLEGSLELAGRVVVLSTNFWSSGEIAPDGYKLLQSFDLSPVPKWVWGEDDWQLTRQMIMPYGLVGTDGVRGRNSSLSLQNPGIGESFCHRILIEYRYEGTDTATLTLRPLIGDRDFHYQQKASKELQFSQLLKDKQLYLQAINSGQVGIPWQLSWSKGEYKPDGIWYWGYKLQEETKRGLGDQEDLYSPGYLSVILEPGDLLSVEARVGFPDCQDYALTSSTFTEAVNIEIERQEEIFVNSAKLQGSYQQLLQASDRFIVYRASIASPTVIAGYHWFNDWGRHTLIALPGLALIPKRFDLAKGLLRTFGRYCRYGLIPNAFGDIASEPFYNSIDAALWWIETLGLYLETTQDWEFLAEQYPVVRQIYKAFIGGTRYNIQVDTIDGLVGWDTRGVALTWMDAVVEGQPVTPRRGKPVEINALWYSALCWAARWAEILSEQVAVHESVRLIKQAQRYTQHAQQVKISLQKFWNPNTSYLYDTIEPDDRRNSQIRPNAILALSLSHCGFHEQQGRLIIDRATFSLLTPYGLRSLDPTDPEYIGKYLGNAEQRDHAYHQGTVWSWLIGPYIRAWQRFYKTEPLPFDWQLLLDHFSSDGCLGSISEIFDGDMPHTPRGAVAQAWSVAEVIRHFVGL